MAKYISDELLQKVLNDEAEYRMSPPYIKAQRKVLLAMINQCQELNQWMTLEEFLKSGSIGLCWVFCKNRVIVLNYDGKFFINPWVNYPYHTEHINHVMPIHKPEPPQDDKAMPKM